MYDRILFPTDGSDGATRVLDFVAEVARAHDATLYVLNVADTTRYSTVQIQGSILDTLEEDGQRIVEDAADRVSGPHLSVVTEVLQGVPADTIVEYAAHSAVDLVVMPTHGRTGINRFLLGSVTERVLRQSDVPVLTVRPDEEFDASYPFERVLVATDGSDCAAAALDVAIDDVRATDTALHVLSVIDTGAFGLDVRSELQVEELAEAADDVVDGATDRAREAGVEDVTGAVRRGFSVSGEIRSYVDEADIDLVVVGTHGRTGAQRYLVGSVAERLVRTAPVPVLAVHAEDE